MEVLEVLMHLSTNSPKNCKRMLDANAAYRICLRINDPEPIGSNGVPLRTKGIFFMSVEILWNLLEYVGVTAVAEQLSNVECITQLKDAFGHQLLQGFSHYDRQLRNDLLVLCTLVAKGSPKAPFVEKTDGPVDFLTDSDKPSCWWRPMKKEPILATRC